MKSLIIVISALLSSCSFMWIGDGNDVTVDKNEAAILVETVND